MNIGDTLVGGMIVASAVLFLVKTKGKREDPRVSKYRKLAVAVTILGFILIMWEPMFALARH
jgi:hypothetical protein